MFQQTLTFMAITFFFVIVCAADDGQHFLDERLALWQKIVDSRHDFGCLEYKLSVDGKDVAEGMMNSSGGYWILERKFVDGGKQVKFSNDEYNADINISKGKAQILSLNENSDSFWDFHFLMTSFHGKNVFPELFRNGKMKIEKYQSRNGLHYFGFRLGNGELFDSNEIVFDESHAMPIEGTNWFSKPKGDGQIIKFLKFETIRGVSLPTEIEYENFSSCSPSSFGKFNLEYSSIPIDKSKCFLEYYGLSKPGYTVAKKNEKSSLWIYFGIGLLLIVVTVCLIRRNSK